MTVADSAEAILASEADMTGAAVSVTDEAVTLSVADFEALAALGATYEGDVTVADSAKAILASEADFTDVAVSVTSTDGPLNVQQLLDLNALTATFTTAPDVVDTLENANGEDIEGVRDLTLTVAGTTPAADLLTATITASGTGTVTFDFADEDDTVTLLAGSTFSGFTTLAVVAGTVNAVAADLGDITDITVGSAIVMTAAQFLALDSVEGLDGDAEVTIVVSTAAEAAAVIAAAATFTGTLDATDVALVAAPGSALTVPQLNALNADLDAAFTQVVADRALPEAIEKLEAADNALTAFEAMIKADYGITVTTKASAAVDADIAATNALIGTSISGGGETVFLPSATQTQARFELDLKETRADLDKAVTDAETAAFTAREKLIVTLNGNDAPVKAYDAAVAVQDAAAKSVLAAGASLAAADTVVEKVLTQGVSYAAGGLTVGTVAPISITKLTVGNKITLADNVKLTANGYEVDGKIVAKAELDALVSAAQAKFDADAAKTAADADLAAKEGAIGVDSNPSTTTDGEKYVQALLDVATAKGNHEAFEAAYDKWVDLSADLVALTDLKADALNLEKAFDTALSKIENAPTDPVKGLDVNVVGLGAVLPEGPDSDLFLVMTDDMTGAASILGKPSQIGIDGVDYLHFDKEYTFVELGATQTINNAVGSASKLEIFAKEVGGNVELYVEHIPTAGNGSTANDVTKLTLNGVTLADLSFDQDNSILTATV